MKTLKMFPRWSRVAACFVTLILAQTAVHATPYATGLTNNAGVVSFFLNEPAGSVRVIYNSGTSTTNLGSLSAGLTTTNLGISGVYQVVVSNSAPAGWLAGTTNQISSDANPLVAFANNRGVAINRNPASPYFGRVYVTVASAGTSLGRSLTDGLYILNPALGQVSGLTTNALSGGVTLWGGANVEGPFRVSIAADDKVYISDWSDGSGTLWVADPNVTAITNVLGGFGAGFPVGASALHGSIGAATVFGSTNTGDMVVYVVDEDLQSNKTSTSATERNSIWRYDIGAGPLPFNGTPTRIPSGIIGSASLYADSIRVNGTNYSSQRRAAPATTPDILVTSDDGTVLFNSLTATRDISNNIAATDLFVETRGIDVSADGRFLAAFTSDNILFVLPIINGIPTITNSVVIPTAPTTTIGRDVAFDAAGNLYTVSSGQGVLRVYSPGGKTIATSGSDGTFSVTNILPEAFISVSALSDGTESNPTNQLARFTLNRTGNLSEDLTVFYTLSGTAVNGTDYATNTLSVVIPAGVSSTNIILSPIDDALPEATETITLTLRPGATYFGSVPTSATISLFDNEPPTISITGVDTNMYERLPADIGRFRFSRLGTINAAATVNLLIGGTAQNGVDYTNAALGGALASTVLIPSGALSVDVDIAPKDDAILESEETISVSVAVGGGYLLGATTNAVIFLRDDDQTNYPSLFSDNFDSDTTANWTKRVGALNALDDSYAVFNYDYKSIDPQTGGDNIPPSPFSTGFPPHGLKVSFNKVSNPFGGATGDGVDAAGGVNFYANGQNFGGNYAVRFSLFMSVAASATTEHAIFGINHSGTKTNWVSQTADPQGQSRGGDGIFFGVVNDASTGTGPNYAVYVSTNQAAPPSTNQQRAATTLTRIFPNPPYSPSATGSGSPGNSAFVGSAENFSWVDVEITQIGRVISLRMNNELIFSYTNTTAFTNGTIMLGYNDQFGSSGTPEGFAVYDDVRVLRLPPSVSIVATDSSAAEPGGVINNGEIQIFLTQASPVDLTVPITMTGTAINGTDYATVPTSVTIPAGVTFTNIAIVPLTDALAESAETVILSIGAGANYLLGSPVSATNTITDSTYVSITATDVSAAEPGTNFNTGQFQITLSPASPTSLTISYTVGGTAINGVDYAAIPTSVSVPAGVATTNITISPLSDNLVEAAETVILTLQAGANYGLGTPFAATNTITDTTPVRPNVSSFTFGTLSNRFLLSGGIGDNTNQFVLESSPVVSGPYNADTTALVEFLSNGFFRITTTNLPINTNIFYRIKR